MSLELKNLLFPNLKYDRQYFEQKFKKRNLPTGAEVTRLAPSPTGEMHSGALYMALINNRIARQTRGKMILRIEDTDKVREVVGSRARIVEFLDQFGLRPDEGINIRGEEVGDYGPYIQSERVEIYNAFLADFVEKGYAYPCFMTTEELDIMREEQQISKVRPGTYGKYAKNANLSFDEIKSKIEKGEEYVIRLRSSGDFNKKIDFTDEVMGNMSLSQNDEHFVIAKSDGVPTYHLAHLVDDYLMGVTYVVRANEWVASITKHLELWEKLGVKPIKYGHLMPINKKDGNSVRKLSKRKDTEASVSYYVEKGYPVKSLIAYLLRLANPNFDDWWHAGNRDVNQYVLDMDGLKRNSRGPLLDIDKLEDISSDYIASMSSGEVAQHILNWSILYDKDFYNIIAKQVNYLEEVLNIERGTENARKDIKKWSDAKANIYYFFDELYKESKEQEFVEFVNTKKVSDNFKNIKINLVEILKDDKFYNDTLTLDEWIEEFKKIAKDNGYEKFGDFMMDLRLSITNEKRTPNMYYLFKVLGKDRVFARIKEL